MPRTSSTRTIVTSGLLVALLCVSVCFTIPLGPVPFTLQTAVIILMALLLTPGQAAAACGVYLLMGAIGLPVFSGMTGGFGKFLGPTGGFLVSYPIAVACAASARRALERRGAPQLLCDVTAALAIIVIADTLGWLWFMMLTQSDPLAAFLVTDAPFIAIDCAKGVLAIAVAAAIRRACGWQRVLPYAHAADHETARARTAREGE